MFSGRRRVCVIDYGTGNVKGIIKHLTNRHTRIAGHIFVGVGDGTVGRIHLSTGTDADGIEVFRQMKEGDGAQKYLLCTVFCTGGNCFTGGQNVVFKNAAFNGGAADVQ